MIRVAIVIGLSTIAAAACGQPERSTTDAPGQSDGPAVDGPDVDAAPALSITTYQPADLVLGQASFTEAIDRGYTARATAPASIAADGGALWICDGARGRALAWAPLPDANDVAPVHVLGRSSFTDNASPTTTADRFGLTCRIDLGGGKLVASDPGHQRVLVWSPPPTTDGEAADVVVGQPDFTSLGTGTGAAQMNTPAGVWTDGTRLAVADALSNRVLIWNSVPTSNGRAADIVLGQPAFGMGSVPAVASASNLYRPLDVYCDGARFYVADGFQHRILIWSSFPTANGQAADVVVGQPDFATRTAGLSATKLNMPSGLAVSGDALFVADSLNDRVLVFTPIPTADGAAATYVLGQPDLTSGGNSPGPTNRSLSSPRDLKVTGSYLWVADIIHNRAVRYTIHR